MMSEVYDVDFKDIIEPDNNTIPINPIPADPASSMVNSLASLITSVSDDLKEYKISKEHEKTQRAAINARMKTDIAAIEAQLKLAVKALDNSHEENMLVLKAGIEKQTKTLDVIISVINEAIQTAIQLQNYNDVNMLSQNLITLTKEQNEMMIALMDSTTHNTKNNMLGNSNIAGYLE